MSEETNIFGIKISETEEYVREIQTREKELLKIFKECSTPFYNILNNGEKIYTDDLRRSKRII